MKIQSIRSRSRHIESKKEKRKGTSVETKRNIKIAVYIFLAVLQIERGNYTVADTEYSINKEGSRQRDGK